MRQGGRALGDHSEQRVRGGRGRGRRRHAGRDPRHRPALRHGGHGTQLARASPTRPPISAPPSARPWRQATGRCCPRAAPARPARRDRPERGHRLCLLRPRSRQGAVIPLRRDDRQRGLPGGARLRRVHPRRGQDRRAADAARGREEPRDVQARGREGAARPASRSSSTRSASRMRARGPPPRTPPRSPARTPPTARCFSATA